MKNTDHGCSHLLPAPPLWVGGQSQRPEHKREPCTSMPTFPQTGWNCWIEQPSLHNCSLSACSRSGAGSAELAHLWLQGGSSPVRDRKDAPRMASPWSLDHPWQGEPHPRGEPQEGTGTAKLELQSSRQNPKVTYYRKQHTLASHGFSCLCFISLGV